MKNSNFIANVIIWLKLVAIVKAQVILKTCARNNLLSCPKNSVCTQISNDDNEALKCICVEYFQLNINWLEYAGLNSSMLLQEHYCISSDKISKAEENKLLAYTRSPARKEHLAFSIFVILMAATLATVVLYGLKVLRSLRPPKSIFQKLKYNKRRNISPLQEMDELELDRRYEMQIL